jgi:uncharacterized protein (DUF2252 family)
VLDVNDFDETLPARGSGDVKRLAASIEVAGRERGFAARKRGAAVEAAVSHPTAANGWLAAWRGRGLGTTWVTRDG